MLHLFTLFLSCATLFSSISFGSLSSKIPESTESRISITIGKATFYATLTNSQTAREFIALLPLSLEMQELNGNEKYHYLPQTLSTSPEAPETIQAGDLMLYGDDCLVLFYESFPTVYTYTPLGHIEDTTGLADAVGSGNVTVHFALVDS